MSISEKNTLMTTMLQRCHLHTRQHGRVTKKSARLIALWQPDMTKAVEREQAEYNPNECMC
jgi:hypothetical protein